MLGWICPKCGKAVNPNMQHCSCSYGYNPYSPYTPFAPLNPYSPITEIKKIIVGDDPVTTDSTTTTTDTNKFIHKVIY